MKKLTCSTASCTRQNGDIDNMLCVYEKIIIVEKSMSTILFTSNEMKKN